jgi:hypothetical protein
MFEENTLCDYGLGSTGACALGQRLHVDRYWTEFQGLQDWKNAGVMVQTRNSPCTRALREYLVHYHAERNHQGKDNILLFPVATKVTNRVDGSINCKERLGGLLKYYHREAA